MILLISYLFNQLERIEQMLFELVSHLKHTKEEKQKVSNSAETDAEKASRKDDRLESGIAEMKNDWKDNLLGKILLWPKSGICLRGKMMKVESNTK